MNTSTAHAYVINQEVTIDSLYFRNSHEGTREIKAFPRRMQYGGREYTFIEDGLRYLMKKGQQLFQVFDMTDGNRLFRLKFNPNNQQWVLVGMRDAI